MFLSRNECHILHFAHQGTVSSAFKPPIVYSLLDANAVVRDTSMKSKAIRGG